MLCSSPAARRGIERRCKVDCTVSLTLSAYAAAPSHGSSGLRAPFVYRPATAQATAAVRRVSPPYIKIESTHYGYAMLILNGYKHLEACKQLKLSPRTVARWRGNLKRDGEAFFGYPVTYEFCAKYAVDSDTMSQEMRQIFS